MKKLLAITVIFALVAGAAFAETSFGGGGNLGADLMSGKSGDAITSKDDGGKAQWWQADEMLKGGSLDFSTSGDNAGAVLRFWPSANGDWWGNAWWQPIDQLKIEFHAKDGEWGHDQIVGWGYIGGPQDLVGMQAGWNAGMVKIPDLSAIAGGTGFGMGTPNRALLLHVTPIDALFIGVGIPLLGSTRDAEEVYLRSQLNVRYAIDGIGTIRVGVKFGPARNDRIGTGYSGQITSGLSYDADDKKAGDYTSFGLAFHLTAVENLGVELGVKYTLGGKYEDHADIYMNSSYQVVDYKYTTTVTNPFEIGLGASFDADPFSIKFRAGAKIGGGWKSDKKTPQEIASLAGVTGVTYYWDKHEYEVKDPFQLGLGIIPAFKVNDNLTVFLNLGLGMSTQEYHWVDSKVTSGDPNKYFNATQVDWFINPYMTLNLSGGTFMVGVKIADNGKIVQGKAGGDPAKDSDYMSAVRKQNTLSWSIPIGITFGF